MPRSRSRSPRGRSPPRGRSRSGGRRDDYRRSPPRGGRRYDSPPRGGYGGDRGGRNEPKRDNAARISLLVRNIREGTAPQDIRDLFTKFGMVKDVYIPLDFHTKMPKSFAFVEFTDFEEASKAKEQLDRSDFNGKMIDVLFAQQQRKAPEVMRARDGPPPRRYSRSPRRSPPRRRSRSPPRRRSRSPPRRRSRSPPRRDSPPRRRASRSPPRRRSPSPRVRSPRDAR